MPVQVDRVLTNESKGESMSLLVKPGRLPSSNRTYAFTAEAKLVINWDVEEVCAWLSTADQLDFLQLDRHQMAALLDAFRAQNITGSALLQLTDGDLRELGVASMGHRKDLLSTIQALDRIGPGTVLMETLLPSGSVAGATLNLCSAVLGAGALSLPYAFARAGVLLTMALLVLAAVATVHTIRLLIYVFEHSATRTFEDSVEGLAGRGVGMAVEVLSFLFCFGCAVAYIVVLEDALAVLLSFAKLDICPIGPTLFIVFFVLLPPSCFRHIDALRVGSLIGIAAIAYVVWTTVRAAIPDFGHKSDHPAPELITLNPRTCTALPIVIFAYSCQVNVWPIYDELKAGDDIDKRRDMMMTASYYSIILSLCAYTLVGYFGYYCYGPDVQGNVLNNYPPAAASAAAFCMIVCIFAAFPMNFYPMRQAINQLLYKRDASKLEMRNGRLYPVLRDPTAHVLQTILLATAIALLGLFVPDLNVVFQLTGALVSSTLCFILPAYLAIQVDAQGGGGGVTLRLLRHHTSSVALILFGIVVAVLGTAATLFF